MGSIPWPMGSIPEAEGTWQAPGQWEKPCKPTDSVAISVARSSSDEPAKIESQLSLDEVV